MNHNTLISNLLRKYTELKSTAVNSPFFVFTQDGYAEPAYLPLPDVDQGPGLEGEEYECQGFIGPQDEATQKDLQAYADLLGADLVWYNPRKPVVLN